MWIETSHQKPKRKYVGGIKETDVNLERTVGTPIKNCPFEDNNTCNTFVTLTSDYLWGYLLPDKISPKIPMKMPNFLGLTSSRQNHSSL